MLTDDERKYELLFNETTTRDADGRYQVHLPFKHNPRIDIGDPSKIAIQQYLRLDVGSYETCNWGKHIMIFYTSILL